MERIKNKRIQNNNSVGRCAISVVQAVQPVCHRCCRTVEGASTNWRQERDRANTTVIFYSLESPRELHWLKTIQHQPAALHGSLDVTGLTIKNKVKTHHLIKSTLFSRRFIRRALRIKTFVYLGISIPHCNVKN